MVWQTRQDEDFVVACWVGHIVDAPEARVEAVAETQRHVERCLSESERDGMGGGVVKRDDQFRGRSDWKGEGAWSDRD